MMLKSRGSRRDNTILDADRLTSNSSALKGNIIHRNVRVINHDSESKRIKQRTHTVSISSSIMCPLYNSQSIHMTDLLARDPPGERGSREYYERKLRSISLKMAYLTTLAGRMQRFWGHIKAYNVPVTYSLWLSHRHSDSRKISQFRHYRKGGKPVLKTYHLPFAIYFASLFKH